MPLEAPPPFQLLRTTSLAYHEAVPGHHIPIAPQQVLTELPRFRRAAVFGDITAFVEGWALYAERLADEEGWYVGDPQGRLDISTTCSGARGIHRRLCRDANAEASQLTVMTNAEVICVDAADGVEAVVIGDARTGRLYAVNATAFLSCGRSTGVGACRRQP